MVLRLVALAIVLALGGYVWVTKDAVENPPPVETVEQGDQFYDNDVQGVDPGMPPEFNVGVELIREGDRANIQFTITEAHGWYVDHIYVDFWYVEVDENGQERQIGDPIRYMCHRYLGFGKTLVEQTTILDIEFPDIDDWGTTANWRARVADHKKVLAPHPPK